MFGEGGQPGFGEVACSATRRGPRAIRGFHEAEHVHCRSERTHDPAGIHVLEPKDAMRRSITGVPGPAPRTPALALQSDATALRAPGRERSTDACDAGQSGAR
jgi:hypothetical protein